MRWRTEIGEWLRGLLFRAPVGAETEEEMRFHVEIDAERRARESGVDLPEAQRQAALAFGGVDNRQRVHRMHLDAFPP